jgi:hypothetical protein
MIPAAIDAERREAVGGADEGRDVSGACDTLK